MFTAKMIQVDECFLIMGSEPPRGEHFPIYFRWNVPHDGPIDQVGEIVKKK